MGFSTEGYFGVSRCGESRADDSEVDRKGDGSMVNAWLTRRVTVYFAVLIEKSIHWPRPL